MMSLFEEDESDTQVPPLPTAVLDYNVEKDSSFRERWIVDAGGPPSSPAMAPSAPIGPGAPQPTPSPVPQNQPASNSDLNRNALIAIPLVLLILLFVCYRCCRRWRRKREQHLMNLRSAQAESVLGDMQLVPSDDHDNELL